MVEYQGTWVLRPVLDFHSILSYQHVDYVHFRVPNSIIPAVDFLILAIRLFICLKDYIF